MRALAALAALTLAACQPVTPNHGVQRVVIVNDTVLVGLDCGPDRVVMVAREESDFAVPCAVIERHWVAE